MNIKVYVLEKTKDKNQLAAIKEYDKRLTRYCKIKLFTLKNEEELNKLPEKSYKIMVHEKHETISSEALADKIQTLGLIGKSDISLILSDSEEFDDSFALSKMTMSTGMSLTVLYEQIYRAYRIMKNEPYHK